MIPLKGFALALVLGLTLTLPALAEEIHMTVKGMTCGGCENMIKDKVAKLPHVKSVEADHAKGFVKVITDNDKKLPAQDELKKAVKAAGFNTVKVEYK